MQTAIAAIFVFLLVILLHELGHFTVAKLVGIRVNEFSIGMGPKVLQKESDETKYTLRLLPIGGYVSMEGEDEKSDDPRSFNKVSPLKRIAVVAAGGIMNFILAIIVLTIVAFNLGTPSTTVNEVSEGSPAEEAGIIYGDTITSIDGYEVKNWEDIGTNLNRDEGNEELNIGLLRDGEEMTLSLTPVMEDGVLKMGITSVYDKSFGSAILGGFEYTKTFIGLMFQFFSSLFRGEITTNDFAGPVGVVAEIGNAAQMGINNLLFLLGFISVNLGFFNLLPIPALDGSRIVFLLVEIIRGKPIDPDKEGMVHFIGIILLLTLMVGVTYKDIMRMNIFG